MRITFLCSDPNHPVNPYLRNWIHLNKDDHEICFARKKDDLTSGDFLFLISCSEIIGKSERLKFGSTLVLHASDLPLGRGWSPHIWQILNGADKIVLSLLEANDAVDSGDIWQKKVLEIPAHFLWDEINHLLFSAEIELIDFAIKNYEEITPIKQNQSIEPTYYPRRTPEHSRLDPDLSIACQFNLIRVCDPVRFPAYFVINDRKYRLLLEKMEN